MNVGELGKLADEGDGVAHADAQRSDVGRARSPDVDVEIADRRGPRLLLRRLQMTGLGADDAEVPVYRHPTTRQEGVGRPTQSVEAQEAVRLDPLDDEPDLVEVRAEHQLRAVLPAPPRGRDVAVAVDVHRVGQALDPLSEVLDERLLESRRAVERNEIPQGLAEPVPDRRGTVCHRGLEPTTSPPRASKRAGGAEAFDVPLMTVAT